MSQERDEAIYQKMDDLGAKYAEAKANRVHLHEFRKSKKAILMKQFESKYPSAAAQEREAYAHDEYVELLEGLKAATEIEELAKNKLEIIKMQFEAWRSKKATERTEMGLR